MSALCRSITREFGIILVCLPISKTKIRHKICLSANIPNRHVGADPCVRHSSCRFHTQSFTTQEATFRRAKVHLSDGQRTLFHLTRAACQSFNPSPLRITLWLSARCVVKDAMPQLSLTKRHACLSTKAPSSFSFWHNPLYISNIAADRYSRKLSASVITGDRSLKDGER